MKRSRFAAVVCAAMLGATAPVFVGCGADGDVIAPRSAEPITQEAALDGYKSATAVLSGSMDTVGMDDATLARLFEIYYNAVESSEQDDNTDTDAEDDLVLIGDFVNDEDAAFIGEIYRAHSIDQRVDVGEDTAQQVDLTYFALTSSLSGSTVVTDETLAGIDEMVSADAVQLDTEAERAVIPMSASGTTQDVQMVYTDRMWKLATTREGVSEMSGFTGFMLGMMLSNTEGGTVQEKAQQFVQDLREHQREVAEAEAEKAADAEDDETDGVVVEEEPAGVN